MSNPEISVIVPIYKVEKYLPHCIDSIMNQTFTDLEIILVDDGSPDNCGKICDEYAAKDSRIRVIHKENGGLSDARNAGISIAKGKYVGFVDSDDFIESQMYEVLYNMIIRDCSDIAICGVYHHFKAGKYPHYSPKECYVCDGKEAFVLSLEGKKVIVSACSKLYQKNVFDNICFRTGKTYEDAFFLSSLLLPDIKVSITTTSYYNYCHRNNSITTVGFSPKTMDVIEAYEYNYEQARKYCQNALLPAEYRLYWAYFTVLDSMLKTRGYRRLVQYPKVVSYLKGNWKNIFRCKHIGNARRCLILALKVNVVLYRGLFLLNNKRNEYLIYKREKEFSR